ncbi:MAG: hypothetical protein EOO46_19445 [Flavobacterium sp.]|nr:MAG: hypothetical protein EOO46_19445 [Flavobacterium sp.]
MLAQSRIVRDTGERYSFDLRYRIQRIADSLISKGVDTILTFKLVPGNGYGGYGKVLWKEKGITKQCYVETDQERIRFRFVRYSRLLRDSTFLFYVRHRVDTITTNPTDEELESISDVSNYVVWVKLNGVTSDFVLSGPLVYFFPSHVRTQFVSLLMSDKNRKRLNQFRKHLPPLQGH